MVRTGLVTMALVAIALLGLAIVVLVRRDGPAPAELSGSPPSAASPSPTPTQPGARSSRLQADPPPPTQPLPGLRLGDGSEPDARSKAQAILDETLAELRRLDASHTEHARDVYMRGHAAAERVEDELGEDDEPGRAQLRADEDAMKEELRRIYGE